jgi:aminopeptidase N
MRYKALFISAILVLLLISCTNTSIEANFEDTEHSDLLLTEDALAKDSITLDSTSDISDNPLDITDISPDVTDDIYSDIVSDGEISVDIVDAGAELSEDIADATGNDTDFQDISEDTGIHKCSYKEAVHTEQLRLKLRIDLKDYRGSTYYVDEEVEVEAGTDGDTITLFGNGHTIKSVSGEYNYDGSTLTICVPPYKKGDTIKANISFTVKSEDDLFGLRRWRLDYNQSVIGPFNEPYYAYYWLFVPQSGYAVSSTYDYSITLSGVEMEIIAPDTTWKAYGPGGLKSSEGNIYRFALNTPIPLYSLSFAVSNYYNEFSAGSSKSGVEVKGVALKSNITRAQRAFSSARLTIDRMEEIIGPYDFGKLLQIVDIPQFGGGMENTTIIWIGSDVINSQSSVESQYVTAHEVIHHWWGDNLMFYDWPHFWLAEGFTEWSTIYEALPLIVDSDTAERIKYYWRSYASEEYSQYGVPLRFSDSDDMMSYFNEVLDQFYKYGSSTVEMILKRLKRDFNKDRYEFLRAWFNAYSHKTATTEDLRQFLIDYTGDFDFWESFFNEWVYSTPCPTIAVSNYKYSNGTVSFDLNKVSGIQKMEDLRVHLYTNNGEKISTASLVNVGDTYKLSVSTNIEPYHIGIDPDYYYVFQLDTTKWNGPSINFGKKDYSQNILPIRRDIYRFYKGHYLPGRMKR